MSSVPANIKYATQIESVTTIKIPQNEFHTAPPSPTSSYLPLRQPPVHLEKDSDGSGVTRVQSHWVTSSTLNLSSSSSSSSLAGSLNTESSSSLFTSEDSSTEGVSTEGFLHSLPPTSTPLAESPERVRKSTEPSSTLDTTITLSVLSSSTSSTSVIRGNGDVWNKTESGNDDRKSSGNFPIGKKSLLT